MYPKLVALDTQGTIFVGELDEQVWGKGEKASQKLADNIEFVDDLTLRDKSNHANEIRLNRDIPRIIAHILQNNASLAIVSRNTSKALCDRALYYFKAIDPKTGGQESIIKLVRYDEVVDEPITEHFKRIHGWSKYDFGDMVLFDSDSRSNSVQTELGITVHNCKSQEGLTWDTYTAGIENWRRNQTSPSPPKASTLLAIAHFNDVYQVSNQKIKVLDRGEQKEETINVMKFATSLSNITHKWADRGDGGKDGLVIFSGDLFSPSTESAITRGRHMPAIVNALGVDVSVVGNHEFDFGYPQLDVLIKDTKFPWLLSNIIDNQTGSVPVPMKEFHVLERVGARIGFIGLVEKDWIAAITGWPTNFEYRDMSAVGMTLSEKLRDPAGEYKCDLVIALTHSRIPNDIKLARALFALSPTAQAATDITSKHGVDLLLGGHDHVYWVSKGVTKWDGYDLSGIQLDAAADQGDVLVVKSGTDFQDISEVILELKDTPAGSIRKKVIQEISGKRHVTRGDTAEDQALKTIFDRELGTINASMSEAIFVSEVQLDCRSSYIRLEESPVGNWVADCLRNAYDEALIKLGYTRADGVIICTGDLRGGQIYEPGPITFGDLMTLLPYPDPLVIVELDGNALWATLESALSQWPTQEGRFPAVSGLRISWDGSRPAGHRVLGIWLLAESDKLGPDGSSILVDKEEVSRSGTRKYLIMVGEYMFEGGNGFDILRTQKLVVTAENGQSKSALIRKYLLGAQFLTRKIQDKTKSPGISLSFKSKSLLDVAGGIEDHLKELQQLPQLQPVKQLSLPKVSIPQPSLPKFGQSWGGDGTRPTLRSVASSATRQVLDTAAPTIKWLTSQRLVSAALKVAEFEDIGLLDPYERQRARMTANLSISPAGLNFSIQMSSDAPKMKRAASDEMKVADEEAVQSLPVIHPTVDGRLKNVGRK
ncbi:5'-nucleotidase family protein [Pleurotus pulmonarius]